jgi:tRNA A37 methylthiotransferase MiaB
MTVKILNLIKVLSVSGMQFFSKCNLHINMEGVSFYYENYITAAEGVQSKLLQSVTGERSRRERERKQKLSEERRKEEEGTVRDLVLWEQEKLFTGTDHEKMESMWEVSLSQYIFCEHCCKSHLCGRRG